MFIAALALAALLRPAWSADTRTRIRVDAVAARPVIPTSVLGVVSDGTNGLVSLQRGDYNVLIRQGTNFVAPNRGVTNLHGTTFVRVPVGVPYYVLPSGASRMRGTNSVVAAEVGLLARNGRHITGRLILAQDTVFDYDPAGNDFRTSLRIGWVTTNTLAESAELLPVHVRLNTGVFRHNTNAVTVERPGIPGEQQIVLTADRPYADRVVKARSSDKNGHSLPEVELVIAAEQRSLWSLLGLIIPGRTWLVLLIGGILGSLVRFRRTFRLQRERVVRGRPVRRWLDAIWFAVEALVIPAATYILLVAGFVTFDKVPWANGLGGALAWGVLVGLAGTSVIEMLGLPGAKQAISDSRETSSPAPAAP